MQPIVHFSFLSIPGFCLLNHTYLVCCVCKAFAQDVVSRNTNVNKPSFTMPVSNQIECAVAFIYIRI